MLLIMLLSGIALVYPNTQIKEGTDKVKSILNRYKSSRLRRCAVSDLKIDNFVDDTVNFLIENERFGDILKCYNTSECAGNFDSFDDLVHHLDGLLVHDDLPERHWDEYKTVFDKEYPSVPHELVAREVWRDNLKLVAGHNMEYLSGQRSYSLGLNIFGDWHVDDYVRDILKLVTTIPLYDPARDYRRSAYRQRRYHPVPRTMDWRSHGFRPRREEQWKCGACYAFAVTHALQGQLYKSHRRWGELRFEDFFISFPCVLSVRVSKQIVDCSQMDGNMGCDGGSLQAAFRYAARAGLEAESSYPYRGQRGRCHYSRRKVRVRPRRWATLPPGDESAMERALATIGPLAVAVNAAPITFQLYRNGIYDDPFCVPWRLNHAMLLVGYTPRYWVLLNWWGRRWGENGYIRIRRGGNACGVSNMATYVEL